MLNAFALVNSEAIYEGQRAAAPQQRVFILTRNGFAGQQRYATASWSGDISSTWTAMRKQVPAGLGFSISGVPYWTLDSGGFSVPHQFSGSDASPADVDEWRELNTRWFEYAAFLPLLRVHGQWPKREMWEYGGDDSPAYRAQLKFDRLRYRLLPYIYSLAGQNNGTFLTAPLNCIELSTGNLMWATNNFGMGGISLVNSNLVAITEKGALVLIQPNPSAYTELSRFQAFTFTGSTPGKSWNLPTFSDGHIYARSTREIISR
jgi:hypothetical protein